MTVLGPAFTALCDQILADKANRIYKAWMLAPTLEVYCALMRNEKVPISQLDAEWVRRFGLK